MRSTATTIEIGQAQTHDDSRVLDGDITDAEKAGSSVEFDDDELDSNAPDSAGVQPTVLAAPPEGLIPAAAQPDRADGHVLGMRRDLEKVMEQITALSSVVHSVLAQQVQQHNAAAPQLREAVEGAQKRAAKCDRASEGRSAAQ